MGTYFNPSNESFKSDISGKIYIDKTGLLEHLNHRLSTPDKCLALSHARRFGKSQAAGMIDAYYSKGCDSHELFSKFEIAQKPSFEEHLNKYNVIHIDMSPITDSFNADVVEEIKSRVTDDMKDVFCDLDYTRPMERLLNDVYKLTNARFVIIIDEWDCVVRVNVNTFQNDLSEVRSKDEVFTALIHLGYLAYNAKTKCRRAAKRWA